MVERDHFTDLVHRELDEDLSPEEKEQLADLLQDHPERQDFRRRLRQLHETLRQVADEAPPADLRQHVLQSVAFQAGGRPRRGGRDVTARRRGLRLFYPLAATLAALSLVTLWWWTEGHTGPQLQAEALSGSMAPIAGTNPWLAADEASAEGLSAQARLFWQEDRFRLALRVDSRQALQVVVSCLPQPCVAMRPDPATEPAFQSRAGDGALIWAVNKKKADLEAFFPAGGQAWVVDLLTLEGIRRARLELKSEYRSGGPEEAS